LVCGEAERERFADELQEYFNRRHCYLFSSGKAALTVVLLALKRLHPGRDRVLIPAFTCYSVPSAIVRAGLKVTLCDVEPGTFDFNSGQLMSCLDDPRLLCVVPTHLYGSVADIPHLRQLLQGRPLPIIEDAAQAMGATWNGNRLGTAGDISLFSLGRGKALSTVEGGILLTDNSEIAVAIDEEMADIKPYTRREIAVLVLVALGLKLLATPSMFWLPKSLPFLKLGETHFAPGFPLRKMSGFQAGLSRTWRERLEVFKSLRRRNTKCWAELSANSTIRPYLVTPTLPDLVRFPVECGDGLERRALLRESDRLGLGLASVYPDAISGIAELRGQFTTKQFPVAEKLARRLVTLPVHPLVSKRDRDRIMRLLDGDVLLHRLDQSLI
jgi:dTDP-4-amino-4,6-dideoxygalactose transaminase